MKKGLICILAALSMLSSSIVSAEETVKTPRVLVNGCEVYCPEQNAVIVDGVTLVPARYVFQMLDAKVNWLPEKQQVVINSHDNIKRIFLTLNSDVMTVATFTKVIESTVNDVKLDVPAQLINDRTLVPLRAVSESLGANVSWDEDSYTAYITTDIADTEKLNVSLATEATDVSKDEEFTVYVKVSNLDIYPDYDNGGISACVKYDHSKFAFTGADMVTADGEWKSSLGASNDEYLNDSVKIVYISVPPLDITGAEQNFAALKFVALTDDGGELGLAWRYTHLGYDTAPVLLKMTEETVDSMNLAKPSEVFIDTTPIVLK